MQVRANGPAAERIILGDVAAAVDRPNAPLAHRLTWLASRLVILALAGLFLYYAIMLADEYYGLIELPFESEVPLLKGSDFPAFYGGARLYVESPGAAYDSDAQARYILKTRGHASEYFESASAWDRYYNPPAYSLVLAPLTLLDLRTAYAISLVVNVVGLGLLLYVLRRLLPGNRVAFSLLCFGVLTSVPVNYAFWHAQATLFLTAAFGLAYIAYTTGSHSRAGYFFALLTLKPHFLAAPVLAFAPTDRKTLRAFLIGASALLLPFLLIGPSGTIDYVKLLLGRGQGDFADSSFSEAVLSWPGFFRGLGEEAMPSEAIVMSAVSLAFMLAVRRRGHAELTLAAAIFAALLIVPHSHPQDWITVTLAAALLIGRARSLLELSISSAGLIGVYLGLHDWAGLKDRAYEVYWPTLAAFVLLVWTFVLSEWQARKGAPGLERP